VGLWAEDTDLEEQEEEREVAVWCGEETEDKIGKKLVSSGSLILDKEKPNEIDGALYGKQA
jgi:hypothetical protein